MNDECVVVTGASGYIGSHIVANLLLKGKKVRATVRDSQDYELSLIHISEPTRLRRISYAVFCLKKKK